MSQSYAPLTSSSDHDFLSDSCIWSSLRSHFIILASFAIWRAGNLHKHQVLCLFFFLSNLSFSLCLSSSILTISSREPGNTFQSGVEVASAQLLSSFAYNCRCSVAELSPTTNQESPFLQFPRTWPSLALKPSPIAFSRSSHLHRAHCSIPKHSRILSFCFMAAAYFQTPKPLLVIYCFVTSYPKTDPLKQKPLIISCVFWRSGVWSCLVTWSGSGSSMRSWSTCCLVLQSWRFVVKMGDWLPIWHLSYGCWLKAQFLTGSCQQATVPWHMGLSTGLLGMASGFAQNKWF